MHELSENVDPRVGFEWDLSRCIVAAARLDQAERRNLLEIRALEAGSQESTSGAGAKVSMHRDEVFRRRCGGFAALGQ
jgi:hypothetical protein